MAHARWAVAAFGTVLLALTASRIAHAGDAAVPGYRRWVDVSSQRPVETGCTYTTHVRGAVIALAASPDPLGLGGRYLPDGLTVESWLACGPADVPRHELHTLTLSAPVTREQLGQAIENAASLEHPYGRDVCSIAPRLDVRAGVPWTSGVTRACEPRAVPSGIGGGPTD